MIIKISAKNASEPFTIQRTDDCTPRGINFNDINYCVFTTHRYIARSFISHYINITERGLEYSKSMDVYAFNGYLISRGLDDYTNSSILRFGFRSDRYNDPELITYNDFGYFSVYTLDPHNQTLECYFELDKYWVLPFEPGIYSKDEVEEFTKLNDPFYNASKPDPYILTNETVDCVKNGIWYPDFANYEVGMRYSQSKIFTIPPGECKCMLGNFVFASKENFVATTEFLSTKHYSTQTYKNEPKVIINKYNNKYY